MFYDIKSAEWFKTAAFIISIVLCAGGGLMTILFTVLNFIKLHNKKKTTTLTEDITDDNKV